MSELVTLENDRKEKLFLEEEARAELFQRVIILVYKISPTRPWPDDRHR